MTPVLVIHDLGTAGGGPWQDALAAAWDGPVIAPDLPGHGERPPPVGGSYELGDAVFDLVDHLPAPGSPQPVIVGIGHNGMAAQILALAGRAAGLVLVDGLGGPWLDPFGRNADLRAVRRKILATPAALEPHAPGSPDPRSTLVAAQTDREHAVRMAASTPVPTLILESPASSTPDAAELARHFRLADLMDLASAEPQLVADAVTRWWSDHAV